ncbi:hypothetical protein Fmac_021208 [Flemingia macrophylla]|uniref:Uncharacterized protein n=1 Tax=Flemingia macrophylla TaxID=520843 RepID=A0ABD1LWA4_9FABA
MESPKKKPKRLRLFRCFKPHDVTTSPKGVDPIFSYIAVPEKHHRFHLPPTFSSVFTATKSTVVKTDNNASGRNKMGKENANSIRKALVSALNHTSLFRVAAKKLNYKRKTKNDGFYSESTSKLSSNNLTSSSPSSLGFTPSSLSTSTNSSTTSTSTQASGSSSESYLSRSITQVNVSTGVAKDGRKGYLGSNMPLSLLFITSLLVLIFWGKCCAIAYTTIGFYVVSNRRKRRCNSG